MKIKFDLKNIPDTMTGIQCRKCMRLIAITEMDRAPEAMKKHVDECIYYYRKEAEAEKKRIDEEFGTGPRGLA